MRGFITISNDGYVNPSDEFAVWMIVSVVAAHFLPHIAFHVWLA
jgi:hypothetical protein